MNIAISDRIKSLPPFSSKHKSIVDALGQYGGWITNEKVELLNGLGLEKKHIKEIDLLIKRLLEADKYFQMGQIAKGYDAIYNLLFSSNYAHEIIDSILVDANQYFYRMRQCDTEYLFSKEELFHIPFQERRKTSNQRYSLTGYPCLYLAKSIYVCWEELNRPNIKTANIIGLKTLRSIHLLDLRMPIEITNVCDYYRIPLIIACSVKVQEHNFPYKPEYTISQAILHAIITHNNENYSETNLNGIIYYSSHINNNQRLFEGNELFENIVIPTVNNTNDPNAEKIYQEGFCPVLCNTFGITTPISMNIFELSENVRDTFISYEDKERKPYENSRMGGMEEHIKQLSTTKIEPNRFFRSCPHLLEKY